MKNDIKIQKDVMKQVDWEPFKNNSEMDITIKSRFATTSRPVNPYAKSFLTEKITHQGVRARNISEESMDIKFVSNLTFVKLKSNSLDLQKKINVAFHTSTNIDSAKIKVKVSGRMVKLTGIVSSNAQKIEIEDTAWLIPGVTSVDSEFIIKDPGYPLIA